MDRCRAIRCTTAGEPTDAGPDPPPAEPQAVPVAEQAVTDVLTAFGAHTRHAWRGELLAHFDHPDVSSGPANNPFGPADAMWSRILRMFRR